MQNTDSAFEKMIKGYGLSTAKIFYRLPDHPSLLQLYVWQDYDIFPRYPVLSSFLEFWTKKLDGPLHSVEVVHKRLISPTEARFIQTEFFVN